MPFATAFNVGRALCFLPLPVCLWHRIFRIIQSVRPDDRKALRDVCFTWRLLVDGAPINVLPVEILVKIFDVVNGTRAPDRKALRSVCKKWNSVVDSFPACNRQVNFFHILRGTNDLGLLHSATKLCRSSMERASSALLDLRLCVHLHIAWDPLAFAVKELLHGLNIVCSAAAPRTRSLDIVGCPQIVQPVLEHIWPHLTDVSLHVFRDPSLLISPSMNAPPLIRFSSTFATPSILSAFLSCGLVTTLDLFTGRTEGLLYEATLDLFLLVLKSCPLLERLCTALDDIVSAPPPDTPPYHHRSLRELYLCSPHPSEASQWNPKSIINTVWSFFDAPSLVELSVPQRWFVMGAFDELGAFFARSGCCPRLIQFIGCPAHLVDDWERRHAAVWTRAVIQAQLPFADYLTSS
ncbi:hypothetical protein K438DRAFT_1785482 [Mycena galopus ATCC 62051]|nr:hypothetical protein K438DRAFT_1785482 [Mycena galopus ATCC 62051]